MTQTSAPRLILFHKQATSARTRFLKLAHGGVCAPGPLPALAQLVDPPPPAGKVALHPGTLLREAERWLSMPVGSLELEAEFRAGVDAAAGLVPVFLAGFTTIDPPFAEVQAVDALFIDLTQARGMVPVDLQLLRRAYEVVLGG
jgi:hypothetical protein